MFFIGWGGEKNCSFFREKKRKFEEIFGGEFLEFGEEKILEKKLKNGRIDRDGRAAQEIAGQKNAGKTDGRGDRGERGRGVFRGRGRARIFEVFETFFEVEKSRGSAQNFCGAEKFSRVFGGEIQENGRGGRGRRDFFQIIFGRFLSGRFFWDFF